MRFTQRFFCFASDVMEGKRVGGGDVDELQKAKRRGRVYMCLHCFHKLRRRVVDVRGRIEDHILREHRTYEEVPFYCSLCYFRCMKREQLVNHITAYKRHVNTAYKANITDHSQYLKQNPIPKLITSMDFYMCSAEESTDHFMKVSKAAEASRLELKDSVLQCLPPSILNIESETTCNIIPEYVPTPISKLSSVSLPSSDSTSTFVKCSDPFYQDQPVIANPVCEGVELNSNESILEDSRVVTVAGSDNENLHDCGIEADIVEIDGVNDKAGESEHENILDQLLPGEEVMDLNAVPQEKRKAEEDS